MTPVTPSERDPGPEDVAAARRRIAPYVIRTPLLAAPSLRESWGGPVGLKLESLQRTGSFKVRGAANRIALLGPEERERGVVTCSSGNHGRAVAFVADALGVPAAVFVPEWVDPVKLEAIRRRGADTTVVGESYDEAEAASLEMAEESGRTYVHPFDDPAVIAGQGTVGSEILDDEPRLETVLVPLSGGGLISGIAIAVKARRPDVRVVGVSAERAAVMARSLDAGEPVTVSEEPTLASALAGGIDLENRWTFRLVRELVDEIVLVPEEEVAVGMRHAFRETGLVVEGGGAVALAAVLAGRVAGAGDPGGPAAVVVSGGNVDPGALRAVLEGASSVG